LETLTPSTPSASLCLCLAVLLAVLLMTVKEIHAKSATTRRSPRRGACAGALRALRVL
jgi:hypothetical protein